MTLEYKLDPYFLEKNTGCANMNFYVKAFESYRVTDRQTDTTEIIYHASSWVVSDLSSHAAV